VRAPGRRRRRYPEVILGIDVNRGAHAVEGPPATREVSRRQRSLAGAESPDMSTTSRPKSSCGACDGSRCRAGRTARGRRRGEEAQARRLLAVGRKSSTLSKFALIRRRCGRARKCGDEREEIAAHRVASGRHEAMRIVAAQQPERGLVIDARARPPARAHHPSGVPIVRQRCSVHGSPLAPSDHAT
jgi:hypothetical protein